jgi:hypothetical protein
MIDNWDKIIYDFNDAGILPYNFPPDIFVRLPHISRKFILSTCQDFE